MTEINPPGWLQNRTDHSANQMRMYVAAAMNQYGSFGAVNLRPAGGVHPGAPILVTATGPATMTVDVSKGIVVVPGTENATQGAYVCVNDGTVNLAIAASDPSLSRTDLVIARIRDAQYSGGTNTFALEVVTGTPGGGVPALPNNSLELARITVGAGVTTIVTGNISETSKKYFSSVGGFERWATTTAFTDTGPIIGSRMYEPTNHSHYYYAPFGALDEFFTTRNASRGWVGGKKYTGTATLYGPATAEATVTNLNTGTFTLPDVRAEIKGHVHCYIQSSVANDRVALRARDTNASGTIRGEMSEIVIPAAGSPVLVDFHWWFPPGAGSVDVVLTCQRVAGTGNISIIGQGTTKPSWHLIEHINTSKFTTVT